MKPFNSLLGETYEIVTPHYRAVAEAVSHHPPIVALNCQGEGYTINKMVKPGLKFTGKQLKVTEKYRYFITFSNGHKVSMDTPDVLVGNLLIGSTYVEPVGTSDCINYDTGEKCEIDFKARGWTTKNTNQCSAIIKDKNGKAKYEISGKYTESLEYKNLETGEKTLLWTAPDQPENSQLMYHMNRFAL